VVALEIDQVLLQEDLQEDIDLLWIEVIEAIEAMEEDKEECQATEITEIIEIVVM
jgi:hypothetical protein